MAERNRSTARRPRLKDKKIKIYKQSSEYNSNGCPINEYRPIHPGDLWAYVRQLSATEYFAAAAVQHKESILFVVNWRDDITASNLIEYRGKFYNITRVDTFEGYKSDLQLYADKAVGGGIPEPGDLLPYE